MFREQILSVLFHLSSHPAPHPLTHTLPNISWDAVVSFQPPWAVVDFADLWIRLSPSLFADFPV